MRKFKIVIARNKKTTSNQEFKVMDNENSNEIIMLESKIIREIENGKEFRTKNTNKTFTLCEIGKKNGNKYLTSIPNDSENDNILSLPKYS
jgi:hypothetical protein